MNNEVIKKILKRLLNARTALINNVPFFSRLLLHLNIGLDDCETAYTDMENVVFDPDFTQRLSDKEIEFVFLHEVLHCALKHCTRGRELDHFIYNIACDVVVNSVVLELLGMKTFYIDNNEVMHLTPDGKEGRIYTAEDVYEMLLKASPEEIDNFCKNNGISTNTPTTQSSKNNHINNNATNKANASDVTDNSNGNNEDDNYQEINSNPLKDTPQIDTHNKWDEITDTNRLNDIWNKRIKDASKACSELDNLSPTIERHVKNLVSDAKVNWKQILHDFVCHNRSDFDFCVPDRRFDSDIIMPSFLENIYGDAIKNLWFLVDTSGSVTDKEISEVYGEIVNCINQMDYFEGKLSFFDTNVTEPVDFTDEDELFSIKPMGGGGTSFYSIFNFLKNNFSEDDLPEAIIILTDGFAPFPDESAAMGIPVIWVISGSYISAPWGKTINVN